MSARTSSLKVVIAIAVACFSGLVAIMLIAASLAGGSGTPSPAPTTSSATPTLPPSPTPTPSSFDQLRDQMLAILKAEGAEAAFELLAGASTASPTAAALCPRVAAVLENVAPETDWMAACP